MTQPGLAITRPYWASLSNGAASIRTSKVWMVGDSYTDGGNSFDATLFKAGPNNNVLFAYTTGALAYSLSGFPTWVMLASQCHFTIAGIRAFGGYTPLQILTYFIPQVIAAAKPGDNVILLSGQNQLSDVTSVLQSHDALLAANLNPIVVTVPPNSTASDATFKMNESLKAYAESNNLPLVDLYTLFVDPTNGNWLSQYNSGDNVHPNIAGYQAGAVLIANTVISVLPDVTKLIPINAALTAQLQKNPLASNALTKGTDWNDIADGGTGTTAQAADSDFVGGECYVITAGAASYKIQLSNYTLTQGHRYRIGMALKSAIATAGTWQLFLVAPGLYIPWSINQVAQSADQSTIVRFYTDFYYPGVTSSAYTLQVYLAVTGTVLKLGEITMEDLTVSGG